MKRLLFAVPVALLLASCAIGYWAYLEAGRAWDAVVDYQSPYIDIEAPRSVATTPVASRVVFVIVDGLRLAESKKMASLELLRDYGADITLTAPQPSLSYPNWTTLLSGAPPYVSGVVTNWHEGQAGVETLFDTAKDAGVGTVFVGPQDFEPLYGVKAKTTASFMRPWSTKYLSDKYVDAAIDLTSKHDPRLVILHLPDADEAGHASGGASEEYRQTLSKVDSDLIRLINALQDGKTVFVLSADHGQIDAGGHGGWERDAIRVPTVIAGPGVAMATLDARTEDLAATVAVFAGIGVPRLTRGSALVDVFGDPSNPGIERAAKARRTFDTLAAARAAGASTIPSESSSEAHSRLNRELLDAAIGDRATEGRDARLTGVALWIVAGSIIAIAVMLSISRRLSIALLAGVIAGQGMYNALFFGVHRHLWSLSAFNNENVIQAWMNLRMAESAASGLVGALVCAVVFAWLRRRRGESVDPAWVRATVGVLCVVAIQISLALQVAWFLWWWGIEPVWELPDLMWGFKFDLDLVQMTSLAVAAVLAPLVSLTIGRYHPKAPRERFSGRSAFGRAYPTVDLPENLSPDTLRGDTA